MMLVLALGVALYSCNWKYFFWISRSPCNSKLSPTSWSLLLDKNSSQDSRQPAKYKEIHTQNISHPNRFVSIGSADERLSPNYEKTILQ